MHHFYAAAIKIGQKIGARAPGIIKKDIRIFGAYYGSFKKAIKILQSKKLKLETILGETLPLKKAAAIVCGKTRVKEDRKIFFDPTCAA